MGLSFHYRVYVFKASHANYDDWNKAKHPYAVKWARGFEPNMITSSTVSPDTYDEQFVGYGGDKLSHLMELVAQGYELLVLPEVFMVHISHPPPSMEKIGFRQKTKLAKCSKIFLDEFDRELRNTYQ